MQATPAQYRLLEYLDRNGCERLHGGWGEFLFSRSLDVCEKRGWIRRISDNYWQYEITPLGLSIVCAGPPNNRRPSKHMREIQRLCQNYGILLKVHEASHAIVGYVLGFEITHVEAEYSITDVGNEYSMISAEGYVLHNAKRLKGERWLHYADRGATVSAAGYVAESVFTGMPVHSHKAWTTPLQELTPPGLTLQEAYEQFWHNELSVHDTLNIRFTLGADWRRRHIAINRAERLVKRHYRAILEFSNEMNVVESSATNIKVVLDQKQVKEVLSKIKIRKRKEPWIR